jgi:hypothetical protein
VTVAHGVDKKFHYWTDIVDHISPQSRTAPSSRPWRCARPSGQAWTEGAQISATMKAYPVPAATGEWNWVVDAKQADTYHTRIFAGWDRYANIKVPRP